MSIVESILGVSFCLHQSSWCFGLQKIRLLQHKNWEA